MASWPAGMGEPVTLSVPVAVAHTVEVGDAGEVVLHLVGRGRRAADLAGQLTATYAPGAPLAIRTAATGPRH